MLQTAALSLAMRYSVTFRSTMPVDFEKHPHGEELANYFAEQMSNAGSELRVESRVDYAWQIEPLSGGWKRGATLGYVGDGDYEWLLIIETSVGWIGRFFGRSDNEERDAFAICLQEVLTGNPSFSEVRWHSGDWGEPGWSGDPAITS